ncbi:nuclear transport factor 2 family protein [Aspergillus undulatus]|uniref:nuclear transport factor 2 family protein n=1 Tax=Aspergillus undulatus TaxID=1810928 RepID=UPI003CCD9E19
MHLLSSLVLLSWQFSLGLCFPILGLLFPTPNPPIDTDTDTAPIPLHDLPTLFSPPSTVDSLATETIRKTLSLYPFAIDGKNFAALDRIFTEDAVANYSAPLGVLSPLSSIQETLGQSLKCVTTQHSLGTQLIDVIGPWHARSVTYYTAAHFGRGELSDQVATAHGQYQDSWERQVDGTWRVVYRNLVYMSEVIGNQAVFVC